LLRGINVGRAKRIAMADLRTLIERLGYSDERTLLDSGNVVFRASRRAAAGAASAIESALVNEIGVAAKVTVLAASEFALAVEGNPFADVARDPARYLLAVLESPEIAAKLAPLVERDWGDERIFLGPRVAYLWCPNGILESGLLKSVERVARNASTTRNWTTVTKLLALAR